MRKILFFIIFAGSVIACYSQRSIAIFTANESSVNTDTKSFAIGELTRAFINSGKYIVVDRSKEIEQIRQKEIKYQNEGYVKDDEIISIGNQAGVSMICAVFFRQQNWSDFTIEVRLVDIEKRITVKSAQKQCYSSQRDLAFDIDALAKEILWDGNIRVKSITERLSFDGSNILQYKSSSWYPINENYAKLLMQSCPKADILYNTSLTIKPIAKATKVVAWIGFFVGIPLGINGTVMKIHTQNEYDHYKEEEYESDINKFSKREKIGYVISGICLATALLVDYTWKIPAKRAVSKYNEYNGLAHYDFDLHLGSTNYGIGIALNF